MLNFKYYDLKDMLNKRIYINKNTSYEINIYNNCNFYELVIYKNNNISYECLLYERCFNYDINKFNNFINNMLNECL